MAKQTFHLETRLVGASIDLKGLQTDATWKAEVLNHGSDPLIVRVGEQQFVALASFGAIGFWDMNPAEIDSFLLRVFSFVTKSSEAFDFADTLEITIGAAEAKFGFDEIELPDEELTTELREVLSCVPTQSVALELYEREVGPLIKELKPIARNIARHGNPGVRQKELLQLLGKIMLIDLELVGTLSLLDKPDRTWYDDDFERYYDRLSDHYNMRSRFVSLTTIMKTLTEHDDNIRGVINIMKGNRYNITLVVLEVVVVLLILFETIAFLYPGWFHHTG